MKEARVPQTECRSHARRRCIHGDKYTALHVLPDAEIMCNSTVMPGQRASINNKSYGFCRLHEAKIPCLCKGCTVHAVPPPQEEGFDPNGVIAAEMQAETREEHKLLDAMDETDPATVAETTPMETIGQRSMETIGQVKAAEARASEIEAVSMIAYYGGAPGGNEAPGDDSR